MFLWFLRIYPNNPPNIPTLIINIIHMKQQSVMTNDYEHVHLSCTLRFFSCAHVLDS